MNGMVKKLAARPNTHFTVSLDSIDPIKYPLIRVYGVLDNVMQNIDTIQSLCTGIIGCSFVIQKDNVYDLPKIVSWCNKRGIEFTYHIMFKMGVVPATDIKPLRVEGQSDEYLNTLREYLLSAEILNNNDEISEKNINMFHQYIERIK
jgi:MoaA/NifB/PqqE/SkfB family radical SAM enzyme